jgi:glycerol kinase
MNKRMLGVDVGTTNVLAMLIDGFGNVVGKASERFTLDYPAPGLVEQDPEDLWNTTFKTIRHALTASGTAPEDVGAVGITGQRSTVVIWERATGKPLGPAVIWQDLRGSKRAAQLSELGFITVSTLAAASKLELALSTVADGYPRMRNHELAWGNVDSYIAFRLSGNTVHATDASNACSTGYFDYFNTWDWFQDLLAVQGLDRSFFPQVLDTAGIFGYTAKDVFGARVPIGAIIGDQQCAAYAQGCLDPGEAKISFGTSGTCNVNTGNKITLATGNYPFVLWERGDIKTFCLEGMVITAGAVFNWLTGIGVIPSPYEAQYIAGQVKTSNGVRFLPALQGLGSPHNRYDRTGALHGLTLAASKGHIVRAAMEGVALRIREMLERIYLDSGLPGQTLLKVDGGATENDVFMQVLSDVLGMRIERMNPIEATAYGAAVLAGEACDIWKPYSSRQLRRIDKVFEPEWRQDQRDDLYHDWKTCFGLEGF